MAGCLFIIVTTLIAFAIHPVLGVFWIVAQILGGRLDVPDQKEGD